MRTVTDEDRARMLAESQQMAWAREEASEAASIGALGLVDVGAKVQMRRDPTLPPADVPGGVVLEVVSDVDEHGDAHRAFRLLDWRLHHLTLRVADVDPEMVEVAASADVRRLVRSICREIVHPRSRRTPCALGSIIPPDQLRLLDDIHTLRAAV